MTRRLHQDPDRRAKPVGEWPAADQALWEAALVPGDPLEEGGLRADYAPISNRKLVSGYGRWLTWLDRQRLLDGAASPGDRITPERVRAYVMALGATNATATLLCRLQELYEAACVMDPDRDWIWIRRIAARVRARHMPARPKRQRLVGADELLALGLDLMALAADEPTPRLRAIAFRDGLIIALLAARPLRRRNLASLVIGETVEQRGADWWIVIPGSATKTGTPIEAPWPAALVPALEIYLRRHRPVLARLHSRWARPVGDALWVSSHGSPMTQDGLYGRIVAVTKAAFGRSINPHLFRDAMATGIAIADPAHVGMVPLILGHRTAATAERYYNQARGIEASRTWQASLAKLRAAGDDQTVQSVEAS